MASLLDRAGSMPAPVHPAAGGAASSLKQPLLRVKATLPRPHAPAPLGHFGSEASSLRLQSPSPCLPSWATRAGVRVVASASASSSWGGAATADPSTDASSSSSSSSSSSNTYTSAFSLDDMERTASTLYDLLGIPRDGSQEEIKGAYRQLARRYHPDVRPAHVSVEECTRRFIEVQEAYEVLSDPQRRAVYDFEMMHGRARGGGHPHARATWRPRQRDGEPLWDSPQDEAAVKAAWKQQWQRQMDDLRGGRRAQAKAGSWAARMREQQQQQEGEAA